MRFDREDATYLSEDHGELADLVSWDADFPFHELSEDAVTLLYEAGRWWSSASVRERPGVRRFLGEISRGERPYLLAQEIRDGYCGVSLRYYLMGGAASSQREGKSFLVETGHQAFELCWYRGGAFTQDHALLLCERARGWVLFGKLDAERLPSLLMEVARKARETLLQNLIEVSRSPSSGSAGAGIHRVSGDEEVYIVSARPESLLGPLGLRVVPRDGQARGFYEERDKNARTLAYLIVFSDLLGGETPILRNSVRAKFYMGVAELSSVVRDELLYNDGALLFSATPDTPSRTMNLVRESLGYHKTGG